MTTQSNFTTASDNQPDRWRTKYFDQLEEQEQETAELQSAISLLRRSLLSLSIAAEGMDGELDQRLTELRERLHKQDNSTGLARCLETIESRLTHCETALTDLVVSTKQILVDWCDEMSGNRTATQALFDSQLGKIRDLRRRIKKYPDNSNSAIPLLSCVVAFSKLRGQIDKSDTETNKGDNPDELSSLWLRMFGKTQTQQAAAPVRTGCRPAESDQTDLSPLIESFVNDLMQSITAPDALALSSEQLRENLNTGNVEALGSQLKQASALLDFARAHDQQELRQFLSRVAHSVEILQGFLDHSKSQQSQASKLDDSLDHELRHRLSSIHTDITRNNNLEHLKSSVQDQLDAMVSALDESSVQKREISKGYEQQITALTNQIKSMENESRSMRDSLQHHQAAMQLDALTQVNNLGAFNARLADEINVWRSTCEPLTICLANINNFSEVNDRYGHSAGDRALVLIAKEINAALKQGDFLARYGGDEFILIKPATPVANAMAAINEIADTLQRCKFRHKDELFHLTLSFGVTEFRTDDSTKTLLERVEEALILARSEGHNCAKAL